MSTEVGELIASVPLAASIIGRSGTFATERGAGSCVGAGRGAETGSGARLGGDAGVDARSNSAPRVSNNRSGCTAVTLTTCLDLSDTLNVSVGAAAGFDFVLNLGKLANIKPRTRRTPAP